MADGLLDDRKDEPREWRDRSVTMARLRSHVGNDVFALLKGMRLSPSEQLVLQRAAEFMRAHRQPDWALRRAASMELTITAAAYTARIDFEHPMQEE